MFFLTLLKCATVDIVADRHLLVISDSALVDQHLLWLDNRKIFVMENGMTISATVVRLV